MLHIFCQLRLQPLKKGIMQWTLKYNCMQLIVADENMVLLRESYEIRSLHITRRKNESSISSCVEGVT